MNSNILFEEKQYLGYNKYSIMRRTVLALFCFIAYYYTEDRERNADLFFLLGISITVISVVLLFILHLHTRIFDDQLMLDGLWTTRKVKIDLRNIVKVEKTLLNRYMLNNPVYNLHYKGTIRFYTGGKEAVKLTDKDGLMYLIGTQRADELYKVINGKMGS
jgi:hypothetical protein